MALHSQGFGCVNLLYNEIPLSGDQTKLSVWTLLGHLLSKQVLKKGALNLQVVFAVYLDFT